ncbi:SUMF1/EgtB/PvdO family nonheme iron enzyme, partial [bacterium]|nr:SUMF1/EgtB/PvdO family nonheme iron enzyme [bacterium]
MTRRLYVLTLLLLFVLGQAAIAGDHYALVIGIDGYQHLGKLKTCVADARALADVLVARAGFDAKRVLVLTDKAEDRAAHPTLANVRRRIQELSNLAEKGDSLLIFFSGHGTQRDGESFVAPMDGSLEEAISLTWVKGELDKSSATTKLLILDACHSGSGMKGVSPIATRLASGLPLMLSCGVDEVSFPDSKTGRSVFARYLVEGMSGKADADADKELTVGEVFTYVKARMKTWCLESGKTQTPLLHGPKAADLHLAEVSPRPVTPPPPRPRLKWEVYTDWPFSDTEAKRRQTETAKALGVEVERDIEIAQGVKMRMVLIPAGEFLMGSPEGEEERDGDEKLHRVRLTRLFWMGKYEVTQAQWEAVMGANPSRYKGAQNPVESVSWDDVQGFLQKVNQRLRGGTVALPTEAQWEYSCRAGTHTRFSAGGLDTSLRGIANYADKNVAYSWADEKHDDGFAHTAPVGRYSPNALGLHDMHGNVWEWCADWYDENYYKASPTENPSGAAKGRTRVLRGGGWSRTPKDCRSAARLRLTP